MNIRVIREQKKITQVELAKSLNVSQGTISQWEKEIIMPRADKLKKLAELFGCSIDKLFEETG